MEAMVEGSKLFINGFVQQEVHIELDVLCGKEKIRDFFIFYDKVLPTKPSILAAHSDAGEKLGLKTNRSYWKGNYV